MYSTAIAYVLFFFGGVMGFHRFYLGKIGSGLLYLLTGGIFGVGWLYDLFTLPMQVREANLESKYRKALQYEDVVERPIRPVREIRKDSIERVILRVAKKNAGVATPSEVALEANTSLEDAKKRLEQLVSKGFSEMRVTKSGNIVYVFPDFADESIDQKLEDF